MFTAFAKLLTSQYVFSTKVLMCTLLLHWLQQRGAKGIGLLHLGLRLWLKWAQDRSSLYVSDIRCLRHMVHRRIAQIEHEQSWTWAVLIIWKTGLILAKGFAARRNTPEIDIRLISSRTLWLCSWLGDATLMALAAVSRWSEQGLIAEKLSYGCS